jgi:four helix bundle protein
MKRNVLKEKSFDFAVSIIELYKNLQESKREFVMTKQILRSGTSIGANISESEHAESKTDFVHKLAIAQKECSESMYWLELLVKTGYLQQNEFKHIHSEAIELMKLLITIIRTTKSNLGRLSKPNQISEEPNQVLPTKPTSQIPNQINH